MSQHRPGLPASGGLSAREKAIGIQALLDLMARLTGTANGIPKLKVLGTLDQEVLTAALVGGETLAQTITKVIELQAVLADVLTNQAQLQLKVDQLISRLQED